MQIKRLHSETQTHVIIKETKMRINRKLEAENLNRDEEIVFYLERLRVKQREFDSLDMGTKSYQIKWQTIYNSVDRIETKLMILKKQKSVLQKTKNEDTSDYLRMIFEKELYEKRIDS